MRSNFILSLVVVVSQFVATNAHAAGSLFRTYLSVDGNDSNACTVSAPCRLLPAAIAATQNTGEVWMLDSANYNTGTVSINQSVSILAIPGAVGSLVANGSDAVHITGTASLIASFRNLVFREINSNGTATGIYLANAQAQVIVRGSEFSNFDSGFYAYSWSLVDIDDSSFDNNSFAIAFQGGQAVTASPGSTATIAGCTIHFNTTGLYLNNVATVLRHNTVSSNTTAFSLAGGINLTLDGNVIVSNSQAFDLQNSGNTAYSMGNNTITANSSGTAIPLTKVAQQ